MGPAGNQASPTCAGSSESVILAHMKDEQPDRRNKLDLRKRIDGYEREARNALALAQSARTETQRQNLLDIAESLAALAKRLRARERGKAQ
jgi:hypothetical protein